MYIIGLYSFNPRICKRCDPEHLPKNEYGYVSIHASVKDATGKAFNPDGALSVSIHASVKDATLFNMQQK